jgi:hypothetical protein
MVNRVRSTGILLATGGVAPWHDIGLLILGLSWAGLGASMLLRRPAEGKWVVSLLLAGKTQMQQPSPRPDLPQRSA